VSRKADVNWNEFVERMSAGLPIVTARENVSRPGAIEASKNPFSPSSSSSSSSRPLFVSPPRLENQRVVVEDDGLQVVPSGSTAPQTWNQPLVPRPLALPLRVTTGFGSGGESGRKGANPFSRPSPDAEGLQPVSVSPMTPGTQAWNPYPTPVSLQTPLNPWSARQPTVLNRSNNPFSHPRYADAEGLQAVVSNLGMEEPEEMGDAYAVSSPANMGARNSLPYPLTPELRNSQPALRWGDPWAQVFRNAFPSTTSLPLPRNYPVQPPLLDQTGLGGNNPPNSPNGEILIAVFGMTGTGKTTFIEKVSGQKLQVGHNLRSCSSPSLLSLF
jgi:hypothetical protein